MTVENEFRDLFGHFRSQIKAEDQQFFDECVAVTGDLLKQRDQAMALVDLSITETERLLAVMAQTAGVVA
jgi:hypothetical protein